MNKLDHYPYKGYDFYELAEVFNVMCDTWDGNGWILDMADWLWLEHLFNSAQIGGRPERWMAKQIRLYLKELAKQDHTYWTPVWEGLLKIEHDTTFMQACTCLIGQMWD